MDKSHIEALAINIVSKANALPSPSENTNIPKVDPCPICGNDIYTLEGGIIKEFTLEKIRLVTFTASSIATFTDDEIKYSRPPL